jgi:hypothetical protein
MNTSERCPACGNQLLTCPCTKEFMLTREYDEWVAAHCINDENEIFPWRRRKPRYRNKPKK